LLSTTSIATTAAHTSSYSLASTLASASSFPSAAALPSAPARAAHAAAATTGVKAAATLPWIHERDPSSHLAVRRRELSGLGHALLVHLYAVGHHATDLHLANLRLMQEDVPTEDLMSLRRLDETEALLSIVRLDSARKTAAGPSSRQDRLHSIATLSLWPGQVRIWLRWETIASTRVRIRRRAWRHHPVACTSVGLLPPEPVPTIVTGHTEVVRLRRCKR